MKKYPNLEAIGTTITTGKSSRITKNKELWGEIATTKLGAYLIVDGSPPVSVDKLDADFISSINLSVDCKTQLAAHFYCELFNRKNQQS